jgi:hypothetical protein
MSEKEKEVLIKTTAICYGTFNCTKGKEALYQEPCECPAGRECLKTWLKDLSQHLFFIEYEELYAFMMKKYFKEDVYAKKKRRNTEQGTQEDTTTRSR